MVAALLFVVAGHLRGRRMVFLLAWLAGTMALMFTLDIVRQSINVVTPRYMVGLSFALYILLAAGLARLGAIARTASTAFLVLAMVAGQWALRVLPAGTLVEDGADFQRASMEIRRGWQPNDLVVVQASYGSVPISLAYYLPPQTPVLALIHLPRREKGPVVSPPNLDDLEPRLNQWASGRSHLWVLRTTASVPALTLDAWLRDQYKTRHAYPLGWVILKEMA